MRPADTWKDYELLDATDGNRLERWGQTLLVRPDPQVIWNTPRDHRGWRRPNGHYHRSAKGGGEWEFFDLPQQWSISYGPLVFNLKPFSFKHTGLFPEQAVNWDWMAQRIAAANRPIKVLNLFAYTGGAVLIVVLNIGRLPGVLALILREPALLSKTQGLRPDMFSSELLGKVYGQLKERYQNCYDVSLSGLSDLTQEEVSHIAGILQRQDGPVSEEALGDCLRTIGQEHQAEAAKTDDDIMAMRENLKKRKGYKE